MEIDSNRGCGKSKPSAGPNSKPPIDKQTLMKRIQENHRKTQIKVNQLQQRPLAIDRGA